MRGDGGRPGPAVSRSLPGVCICGAWRGGSSRARARGGGSATRRVVYPGRPWAFLPVRILTRLRRAGVPPGAGCWGEAFPRGPAARGPAPPWGSGMGVRLLVRGTARGPGPARSATSRGRPYEEISPVARPLSSVSICGSVPHTFRSGPGVRWSLPASGERRIGERSAEPAPPRFSRKGDRHPGSRTARKTGGESEGPRIAGDLSPRIPWHSHRLPPQTARRGGSRLIISPRRTVGTWTAPAPLSRAPPPVRRPGPPPGSTPGPAPPGERTAPTAHGGCPRPAPYMMWRSRAYDMPLDARPGAHAAPRRAAERPSGTGPSGFPPTPGPAVRSAARAHPPERGRRGRCEPLRTPPATAWAAGGVAFGGRGPYGPAALRACAPDPRRR